MRVGFIARGGGWWCESCDGAMVEVDWWRKSARRLVSKVKGAYPTACRCILNSSCAQYTTTTLGLESNVTEQWCGVDGMEKRPVVRKICGRAPRFLTGAVAANASRNGGHAHSQAAQINAAAHTIRHHAYHRRAQVHRGSITTICSAGLINPERLTLKSSNRISHRALPNIAANACKLTHRRRELA